MLFDLYWFDVFFPKLLLLVEFLLVEFLQITLDLDLVGMLITSVNCIAVANLSAWNQRLIIYIYHGPQIVRVDVYAKCAIRNSCERASTSRRTSGIIGSIRMTQLWFRADLIASAVTHSPNSRILFAKIENIAQRNDLCRMTARWSFEFRAELCHSYDI